jgi:spiro-SPASM protein
MDKVLIVCTALGITEYACRELAGSAAEGEAGCAAVWQLTLKRLRRGPLSAFDCVLVREEGEAMFSPEGEGIREMRIAGRGVHEVLTALRAQYSGYQWYLFADIAAPFVDPDLYLHFLQRAEGQIAHYTYGEHYPRGAAPQVLSAEAIEILHGVSSARNFPFSDEAIFDLMGLDINSYDIEMVVSPEDFRRWRLNLRVHDAYSFALFALLLEKEPALLEHAPYSLLSETLLKSPDILRVLPSYLELDLSGACQLSCNFCPRTLREDGPAGSLAPAPREKVLALIRELAAINPGATLALSPYSEPLLSSDFTLITQEALLLGLRVVIETNGLALDDQYAAFFAGLDEERSIIIISPDFAHGERYREAKGKDVLGAVEENIRRLFSLRKRNVWLQIIQFEKSDEEMDAFYAKWKEYEDAILPRKYNNWCGRLPGQAAVDLSPIRRSPCWHLARDLVVHADGSVRLCKQDIGGSVYGNVFEEGLEIVWKRLDQTWRRHLAGQQDWGDALCSVCDEWHTFNY